MGIILCLIFFKGNFFIYVDDKFNSSKFYCSEILILSPHASLHNFCIKNPYKKLSNSIKGKNSSKWKRNKEIVQFIRNQFGSSLLKSKRKLIIFLISSSTIVKRMNGKWGKNEWKHKLGANEIGKEFLDTQRITEIAHKIEFENFPFSSAPEWKSLPHKMCLLFYVIIYMVIIIDILMLSVIKFHIFFINFVLKRVLFFPANLYASIYSTHSWFYDANKLH